MSQDLVSEILELATHESNSWFDDAFVLSVSESMKAKNYISDKQLSSLKNIKEKLENSIERWESRHG